MEGSYFTLFTWCILAVTTFTNGQQCPEALACMNDTLSGPPKDDLCRHYNAPAVCIGGLKDVCELDESVLTFNATTTTAERVCQALTGYNYGCQAYLSCLQQNAFVQVLGAMALDPSSVTGKLLDAGFWCRSYEHSTGCLISTASSCGMTPDQLEAIQPIHQQLAQTCPSTTGPQCPEALSCLNETLSGQVKVDACSHFNAPAICIGGLKDVCELDESVVTFDTTTTTAERVCDALRGHNYECEAYTTCVQQNDFVKLVPTLATDPASAMGKLLDAGFWCRSYEQSSGCLISTAGSCNMTADRLSAIQPIHQQLAKACSNSGNNGDGTGDGSGADALNLAREKLLLISTTALLVFRSLITH